MQNLCKITNHLPLRVLSNHCAHRINYFGNICKNKSHFNIRFASQMTHEDLKRKLIQNLDRDSSSRIKDDVLIYENPRTRFYSIMGIFNAVQLIFWMYGANIAYRTYFAPARSARSKDTQIKLETDEEMKIDKKIDSVESLWEMIRKQKKELSVAAVFVSIGYATAIALCFYSSRSVRYIIIRRGGQKVRITCFSAIGLKRLYKNHDTLIENVSCHVHRNAAPAFIPLKIKGKRFYFLIDTKGHFYHPITFDETVGVFRLLK